MSRTFYRRLRRIAKKIPRDYLDSGLDKADDLIKILSSISSNGPDEEISNPSDIRDLAEEYLSCSEKRTQKTLNNIYFQLKRVVTSGENGVPDHFIESFFEDIIHVEFSNGCDRMTLFDFVLSLDDNSVEWYALVCCFLTQECRKYSHIFAHKTMSMRKPGRKTRTKSAFKVFNVLCSILGELDSSLEYKSGIMLKK